MGSSISHTVEPDPQIPTEDTVWQLWHHDMFDRDSPPALQASGEGMVQGLYELWLQTLKEGIHDNGSASFSRFQITWGNRASMRADAGVKPFHNTALLKLRGWAHLMSHEQEEPQMARHLVEQRVLILSRLAHLHYERLQTSRRWKASSIDMSAEAREILARVETVDDPAEL